MKNEVKNSETVTITKAEYDSLKQIESEFNWLKEQLQISKKKTFGSSSERTEQLYQQMTLFFNEAEALEDTENRNTEITVEQYKRKQKTGCFDKLPENVETYTVEHELSEEERKCPECGEEMEVIGKKVTKHLEMIPAQVRIREDVYFTYACRRCHENEADTPVVETPTVQPVAPEMSAPVVNNQAAATEDIPTPVEIKEPLDTEKVFVLNEDPVHIDIDQENLDRMAKQLENTMKQTNQQGTEQTQELPKEQTGSIQF